jgi:hypothetical protein
VSASFLVSPVPRLALTKPEAAAALGISIDSLERYVIPYVKVIRKGKLVLIDVEELRRWCRENSEPTLEGSGI